MHACYIPSTPSQPHTQVLLDGLTKVTHSARLALTGTKFIMTLLHVSAGAPHHTQSRVCRPHHGHRQQGARHARARHSVGPLSSSSPLQQGVSARRSTQPSAQLGVALPCLTDMFLCSRPAVTCCQQAHVTNTAQDAPSGCKPLVHLQCALPSRTLHCREHDCTPADSQWHQDGEGCEKQHASKARVMESRVQGGARRQRGHAQGAAAAGA